MIHKFQQLRTTLSFLTLCSSYDTQTLVSVNLNGLPAVFYSKMTFSKQHGLRSGHACFRANISFDNKWSFCYVFLLFFVFLVFETVVCCKSVFLVFVAFLRSYFYVLSF